MFVPIAASPMDALEQMHHIPPQPLLIPLIELLLRVSTSSSCNSNKGDSRGSCEYCSVLLQLLRVAVRSTVLQTMLSPSMDMDLLLSALVTATKAVAAAPFSWSEVPIIVRELVILAHRALAVASRLVAKAVEHQQQEHKHQGHQQQQQGDSEQQGKVTQLSSEQLMRRAQQFLYAAGRLIFACQHELGYALARWAVDPGQGRQAASQGGATAANAGMGEVRAAARVAGTAAGLSGAATATAAATAAAAAASSNNEAAPVGAEAQKSKDNHEAAAAAAGGGGGGANTPQPDPLQAAFEENGFRLLPAKEGIGLKVYQKAVTYVAVCPDARSQEMAKSIWAFASSLVVSLQEQCTWEVCGSADAAFNGLSDQIYRVLSAMPKPVLRQVQSALQQVKLPLWVPKEGGRETELKFTLVSEWQRRSGKVRFKNKAAGVTCLGLLAEGLVHGLPAEFACNNGYCRNLEGFGELALVRGRAQVVCRGCRVARYCCRECQEEDLPWHKAICKLLQQRAHELEKLSG